MKELIDYEIFANLDLRIGTVLEAEKVSGSDKLLKLTVSLGEEDKRQIVAGIGINYSPEDIVGKQLAIVANLKPKTIMGLESQGMIMAASGQEGPIIIKPEISVLDGTNIN